MPTHARRSTHPLQEFCWAGKCLTIIHLNTRTLRPVISIIFPYISINTCTVNFYVFRMTERRRWVLQWFQSQVADFYDTRYESWSYGMTNVSIPEVDMWKNSSSLSVSVRINLSVKLGFVSINGSRDTYFVNELRTIAFKKNGPPTNYKLQKHNCAPARLLESPVHNITQWNH